MIQLLILFLILFPILEIALLIKVGENIGLINTLFFILLSGVLGFIILKNKLNLFKLSPLQVFQKEFQKKDFLNQILYLFAGLCLILPGFLSDFIGLSIFLNPIRKIYLKMFKTFLIKQLILKRIQFHHFKTNSKESSKESWGAYEFKMQNQKNKHTDSTNQKDPSPSTDLNEANHQKPFSNVIDFNSRKKKDQ